MSKPSSLAQELELHESTAEKDLGGATTTPPVTFDEVETAKILRKVDWRLVPVLSLLYLMSFLDRGNMGNAEIVGLSETLGLTDAQYNLCLTVFFFPYACFEVPSNIMLKILRPSIWIPILMLAWGTIMTLMGLVQGYSGLLAARFFLGVAEAGFFPAGTYIITSWYCRHETQWRMAMFYSAGTMAGAFSGLLAYAIDKMDGIAGLAGWRWIFILEGILTVVVGFCAIFILPDSPSRAKFLSADERRFLEYRLRVDTGHDGGSVSIDEPFQRKFLWQVLKDWKIYLSIVVYWGNAMAIYGFIYTLPVVINNLGYSAENAQLLTIPVYAVAVCSTLTAAYFSDRLKTRSPFIIFPLLLCGAGFICLMAVPKHRTPGAIYFLLFIVAIGLYTTICGVVSWTANNLAGSWKRAIGMAVQISIGNLGGTVGSNIYLAREKPYYWLGYGFSLGIVVAAAAAAAILRIVYKRENAKREKMSLSEIREKYSEQELEDLGDKSPLFRYSL